MVVSSPSYLRVKKWLQGQGKARHGEAGCKRKKILHPDGASYITIYNLGRPGGANQKLSKAKTTITTLAEWLSDWPYIWHVELTRLFLGSRLIAQPYCPLLVDLGKELFQVPRWPKYRTLGVKSGVVSLNGNTSTHLVYVFILGCQASSEFLGAFAKSDQGLWRHRHSWTWFWTG